jgi:lipid II:glycine glycyltransferase (peptidoglycan interpeptide bridge formation enzyme)
MPDGKEKWDKQQTKRYASFLQSSWWAKFQGSLGITPHFIDGDGWSCLLLEKKTRLGNYFFAPYGPTLDSPDLVNPSLAQLKDYGHAKNIDWLRLEPIAAVGGIQALKMGLKKSGARASLHLANPDLTSVVSLTPSAESILASISQSTRSFIRKNQREKFLTFKTSTDPTDIKIFIEMLALVSKRNRVYFFPDEYFNKQAELLMPAGMMHLELAFHDKTPVAAAVLHDYGELTNYTYAASMPEARQTSASALLLWQAMLNAKARDMQKMDLHGLAPDDASASHPWYGFSSFKKKFGGQLVEHSGTWDVPLSPRYGLYRVAMRARRAARKVR